MFIWLFVSELRKRFCDHIVLSFRRTCPLKPVSVLQAIDKKTRETVALKKVFDAFQNATDAQRTFREIMYVSFMLMFLSRDTCMRACFCKNWIITKISSNFGMCCERIMTRTSISFLSTHAHVRCFHAVFYPHSQCRYMDTDLHHVIRANILEEVHKQYIMYQLLKSLKYSIPAFHQLHHHSLTSTKVHAHCWDAAPRHEAI
jgi:hypothetical protein